MRAKSLRIALAILLPFCVLSTASAVNPEDVVAGIAKIVLGKSFNTDWDGLDQLSGIKWAPLPPKTLEHCLPDSGCFLRKGTMMLGGANVIVIATGARTIVSNIYLRNP